MQSPSQRGKTKIIAGIAVMGVILMTLGTAFWIRRFHGYTPLDVIKDVQAAEQARRGGRSVKLFLDLRYGDQTNPANRRKAFIDFFNAGHVEGLYFIVDNRTDARTRACIADAAKIFANYRQAMSPDDKESLKAYFDSNAGRTQIQQAIVSYQTKDVRFRAVIAPVVQELMTTLTAIQTP